MHDHIQTILNLDKVVNDPSRLAILTILSSVEEVEWRFLEAVTKLSRGNLSTHLARLNDAGYIQQKKGYRGKIPQTLVSITPEGIVSLNRHWAILKSAMPVSSDS